MIAITRGDLALSSLALAIIIAGVGALLVAAWRRRAAGTLVWFGLFSVLYGTRVVLGVQPLAATLRVSGEQLAILRFDITYIQALPLMLLVQEFVGIGWRHSMRAAVWVQAIYSVGGVVIDALAHPGAARPIKPYVILGLGLTALGNAVIAARWRVGATRALAVGFFTFLFTVGAFNLGEILHRPVSPHVEVVGFVVLLACLAYSVLVRAVDTDARLVAIQREIETARRIQTAILPAAVPCVPGLTLAVQYRPVATMTGDFYDFVDGSADRVGVLIADASGHGVPAALIASMLKVAVTAEASRAADAGALLTAVNARLVPLLGRDRDYVTACYVRVDRAAGLLHYARAGHPPPLVRRPGGEVRLLDGGGTILGQFEGARYDETVCPLEPGSRILLYTDGISEAANPAGEFFGIDRLHAWLADDRSADAERCVQALFETIAVWRRRVPQADDVTAIVIDVSARAPAERSM